MQHTGSEGRSVSPNTRPPPNDLTHHRRGPQRSKQWKIASDQHTLKQQNNNKKRCLHVEEDHREHEEDVDEVEDEEQEVGGKVL